MKLFIALNWSGSIDFFFVGVTHWHVYFEILAPRSRLSSVPQLSVPFPLMHALTSRALTIGRSPGIKRKEIEILRARTRRKEKKLEKVVTITNNLALIIHI